MGDRLILLDAGSGPSMGPLVGFLAGSLRMAGFANGDITDIVISHSHPDHAAGLVDADGRSAYSHAVIRMSTAEWTFMQSMPALSAVVQAIRPQVRTFEPGATILPDVDTVALPGHTPGHVAIRIRSGGESLLYIGDGLHHPVISVRHPEWPMVFDDDPEATTRSRLALMEMAAQDRLRLYAGHFPYPGLGRIERRGDGFVWVSEP